MSDNSFTDPNSFAGWLESYDFFDCGSTANFLPSPAAEPSSVMCPATISFDLGLSVGGSYDAGQLRRIKRFRLSGKHVKLWRTEGPQRDYALDGPLIDGLEVNDDSNLIDFVIDGNIHVCCCSIEIESLPDAVILNRPAITTRSAVVHFPTAEMPSPTHWIEWLASIGVTATWQQLYGEPVMPQSISQTEYEGWFLQKLDLVESATRGVMLKTLTAIGDGFLAEFNDWGQAQEAQYYSPMWKALAQVTANIRNSSVRCGNCLLSGSEWLETFEGGTAFLNSLDFESRCRDGVPNGWFPKSWGIDSPLPSRTVYPGGISANFGLWPYRCDSISAGT